MNNIYEALLSLGYPVKRSGNYFVMPALYRSGDNPNALSIHQETGRFRDFVTGDRGSWNDFLRLALDGNKELIEKYSKGEFQIRDIPQVPYLNLMQIKKYDESMLNKLIPYYDFYLKRGISKETLQEFQVGLATAGKLKNRLVFPIRMPENRSIIGFAGRLIHEHEFLPKWLLIGKKTSWAYPLHITESHILDRKEIILVESIGDSLALYENGIKNIGCLFGLTISKELLKKIISLNIKKVIISLNNDYNKINNSGQEASFKLQKSISKFFDNVEIIPPKMCNDWGECSKQQIQDFWNEKNK